MKSEDSRRFPQRRNGVHHSLFGDGVVTIGPGGLPDGKVMVKFDEYADEKAVPATELTSLPSRGESPDPATSRFSGWVGGSSYHRTRK